MPPLSAAQLLGFVLLDLTIILVAARLVGTVFTRIGQPRVVGEIVAGVLLGPTLLGPTLWPGFGMPASLPCAVPPGMAQSPGSCLFPEQARDMIGQLGQIGLLLFSFLTALALDRGPLRRRKLGIALVGPGAVLLPVGMGAALGPVLATPVFKPPDAATVGFTLFAGVLLAATALPVMVRILQERGLTRSALGCTGIAASAVATVGLFVTASIAASLSSDPGAGGVLRSLLLAAGYLAVMLLLVRPLLARFAPAPG
ncbi:MAG: cation:proton antiporter, partial [Pseudonocardiaceae bacterium]